ncbi:hypothetical protein [Desulfogranum japonicum]|uniref:hypothetical protein n=1 Tax=Desulfogranum japonicum TaxID=231447 RepID=UPI0004172B3A|nr:hypothetical protein [Desulfogranum japonicum]
MVAHAPITTLPPIILERLKKHRVLNGLRRTPKVFSDTTDFTAIDYGDVINIENEYFLVTSFTKEGRFGVDEQIKPWVPKVEELTSSRRYIVKLVFHERFDMRMGQFVVTCYRNPEKEAQILELVEGRPHFMQGRPLLDAVGNLVRVIEPINGYRLDKYIHRSGSSHEEYFYYELPSILERYLKCVEGIIYLHSKGFRHGDIRRDHIFVDRKSGEFSWIDYDYDFYLPERPFALDLFELGNILLYLTGREHYTLSDLSQNYPTALPSITPDDMGLLVKTRVVNLKKIFPYIPDSLNNILLHFSTSANVFYESTKEFYDDLLRAWEELS